MHINTCHLEDIALRINGHVDVCTIEELHGVKLLVRGIHDIVLQLLKFLVIKRAVIRRLGFIPRQHRQLAHTTEGFIHRLHKTVLGLGE